jgi:acetylornithine deacetylase/succinyl-diaminopimelate desuccinylase-like protein
VFLSFIENCRHFIGLDSTPSRGTREVADFAARLCKEANLQVELDVESLGGVEQVNLLARPGLPQKGEVLIQSHLDTVDPGHFSDWTETHSNPFAMSIYGDWIYGLGVADGKIGFLCQLEAIKTLGNQVARPFVLVGTYGAHLGMAGAVRLMRKKRIQSERAIVSAPTEMRLGTAGPGLAVVSVSVPFSKEERKYREDHDELESGSTQSKIFVNPLEPLNSGSLVSNPIFKMLDYLIRLPTGIAIMDLDGGKGYGTWPSSAVLEIDVVAGFKDPIVPKIAHVMEALKKLELQLSEYTHPDAQPPHPTIHLGMIRTESEGVQLSGICHLPSTVTDQDYRKWIEFLRTECERVGADFAVREYKPAFHFKPESSLSQLGSDVSGRLGMSRELVQIPTCTEANVFSRFGVDCLVIGPGMGVGNSRAPNEKIKMSDLHRATEFYRMMLKEL